MAAAQTRIAGSTPPSSFREREYMRIWNVSGWGHSIANQLASQKGLVAGHQIAFPGREALLDDERQSGPKTRILF